MLKLITMLAGGFTGVISSFIALVGRKAGTAAASITAFVIITSGFIACINSILNSVLTIITMPGWIANAIGIFIPSDFSAVIAGVVSSRICRAAYELAMLKLEMINNAS
jgi:hypothetical protein